MRNLLFIVILIIAVLLRVFALSSVPSGFFCDEASIGYNAYSILHTGKDEYGVSFPIFFQSFGDFRPPLSIYSTIPFIDLFGLNEIAVRLPSVMYGLITIFAIYFICKEIKSDENDSLGLIAAFVASTMPWLIHYNRTGFEFSIYVAFFTVTILLLLKSVHNISFLIPASILASLTFYTYQPAKLIIPLLLLGFVIIYRETFLKNLGNTIAGLAIFIALSVPLILSFTGGQAFARFNAVSVFSPRLTLGQNLQHIINNYSIQLSPSYFISGEDTFITRHFVGGLTPLLIPTLPFLAIGVIYIFLTVRRSHASQLLIYWLFIYPIAGAVTASPPFTSRSIIGAPLFAILVALGITKTIKYLPLKKITFLAIILLITVSTIIFTQFYFTKYPLYSSNFWGWQYGPRDIISYFVQNKAKYDDLIMIGEFNAPEIFFKFYAPENCYKCKIGTPDNLLNPLRKQLFAVTPEYLITHPYKFITKKIIYYPNKRVAFQIDEVVQ